MGSNFRFLRGLFGSENSSISIPYIKQSFGLFPAHCQCRPFRHNTPGPFCRSSPCGGFARMTKHLSPQLELTLQGAWLRSQSAISFCLGTGHNNCSPGTPLPATDVYRNIREASDLVEEGDITGLPFPHLQFAFWVWPRRGVEPTLSL